MSQKFLYIEKLIKQLRRHSDELNNGVSISNFIISDICKALSILLEKKK